MSNEIISPTALVDPAEELWFVSPLLGRKLALKVGGGGSEALKLYNAITGIESGSESAQSIVQKKNNSSISEERKIFLIIFSAEGLSLKTLF